MTHQPGAVSLELACGWLAFMLALLMPRPRSQVPRAPSTDQSSHWHGTSSDVKLVASRPCQPFTCDKPWGPSSSTSKTGFPQGGVVIPAAGWAQRSLPTGLLNQLYLRSGCHQPQQSVAGAGAGSLILPSSPLSSVVSSPLLAHVSSLTAALRRHWVPRSSSSHHRRTRRAPPSPLL